MTLTPDLLKDVLTRVRPERVPFTVVFSGESDRRVNGYYTPSRREITVNDRNFSTDPDIIFTALHEYAHHISMTELGVSSASAHSPVFWATFHELLAIASDLGIYNYPFKAEKFSKVTETLNGLIAESGDIAIRIGRALVDAAELCKASGVRLDDYVMRELKQNPAWSKACMGAFFSSAPAQLGPDNQKLLASIRNPYTRRRIEKGLLAGMSQAQAKMAASGKPRAEGLGQRGIKEEAKTPREE